MLGILI